MKKKVLLILIAVLLLIPMTAFADGYRDEEIKYNEKILISSRYPTAEVYINGQFMDIGQIQDGRTMVKLRRLAEALGFDVDYEHDGRYIYITDDNKDIKLQINNKIAEINGEEITLDVAPFIEDDLTIVPLRFISEGLGEKVTWNQEHFLAFVNDFREDFSEDVDGTVYSGYLDASFKVPEGFLDVAHITVIPEGDHEGLYLIHNDSEEALEKDYPEGFGGVMWRVIKSDKPEKFPSHPYYVVETNDGNFITIAPESDMGFTDETVEDFKEVSKLGEKLLRSISFEDRNIPIENGEKILKDFGPEDIFSKENLIYYSNDEEGFLYYSNNLLDENFSTLDGKVEIKLDKDDNITGYSFKNYYIEDKDFSREKLDMEGGKALVERFQEEILGKNLEINHAPDGYPSLYEEGVHECFKDSEDGIFVVDLPKGILEYYKK